MSASDTPVHTCSYSCQRPECMNAQRAELLAKLAEYESVDVPEDVIGFFAKNAINDKVLCVHKADYNILLRAYRAQAVRLREAEKDAERYRWLREQNATLRNDAFLVLSHDEECKHCDGAWVGADLDAAIDAARGKS